MSSYFGSRNRRFIMDLSCSTFCFYLFLNCGLHGSRSVQELRIAWIMFCSGIADCMDHVHYYVICSGIADCMDHVLFRNWGLQGSCSILCYLFRNCGLHESCSILCYLFMQELWIAWIMFNIMISVQESWFDCVK